MLEKIRLLMEETGCEQGEAELALELAGKDLEKAIKTIGSLLRNIAALKGKISFPEKSLYGLLLIIVNKKTHEVLRLHTVVTYNPTLYENSPGMDWYALEKLIFSYRLDEGSLPDFTQTLEQKIRQYLPGKKEMLAKCEPNEVAEALSGLFLPEKVSISLLAEELNLAQFRRLPSVESTSNSKNGSAETESGMVKLEVDILEDKSGKEVNRLAEGDMVLSQITDPRDIAHYLAHLIGGRREGGIVPLPAVVKRISVYDKESEVQVHYAPGIVGVARVRNDIRVKLLETRAQPWWKRIIPWP